MDSFDPPYRAHELCKYQTTYQATKDRLDAAYDYEINLKAELEIASLHAKMDELREKQWSELVSMQQEQINLLTKLLEEKNAK